MLPPRHVPAAVSPPGWAGKESFNIVLSRKGEEVVNPLADANIPDRQSKLRRDGDRDPTLRCAVQLRQHNPGDGGVLEELSGLGQTVLTHGRVKYQQHLVRRAFNFACDATR